MPHLFTIATRQGWADVLTHFGAQAPGPMTVLAKAYHASKSYENSLEEMVTKAFKQHTGQILEKPQIHVHPRVNTSSMPTPLAIIVALWETETAKHAEHFEAIRRHLEDSIRDWCEELATTQVKLVVVDQPTSSGAST